MSINLKNDDFEKVLFNLRDALANDRSELANCSMEDLDEALSEIATFGLVSEIRLAQIRDKYKEDSERLSLATKKDNAILSVGLQTKVNTELRGIMKTNEAIYIKVVKDLVSCGFLKIGSMPKTLGKMLPCSFERSLLPWYMENGGKWSDFCEIKSEKCLRALRKFDDTLEKKKIPLSLAYISQIRSFKGTEEALGLAKELDLFKEKSLWVGWAARLFLTNTAEVAVLKERGLWVQELSATQSSSDWITIQKVIAEQKPNLISGLNTFKDYVEHQLLKQNLTQLDLSVHKKHRSL